MFIFPSELFWSAELAFEPAVWGGCGYGSEGESGVSGGNETGEPSDEVEAMVLVGNMREMAIEIC